MVGNYPSDKAMVKLLGKNASPKGPTDKDCALFIGNPLAKMLLAIHMECAIRQVTKMTGGQFSDIFLLRQGPTLFIPLIHQHGFLLTKFWKKIGEVFNGIQG